MGNDRKKKNRSLILSQLFNSFSVKSQSRKTQEEAPTSTTANISEVSNLIQNKNISVAKINFPQNLSTVIVPSFQPSRKIPKLNLPNVVSSHHPRTQRINYPKFEILLKNEEKEKLKQQHQKELQKKLDEVFKKKYPQDIYSSPKISSRNYVFSLTTANPTRRSARIIYSKSDISINNIKRSIENTLIDVQYKKEAGEKNKVKIDGIVNSRKSRQKSMYELDKMKLILSSYKMNNNAPSDSNLVNSNNANGNSPLISKRKFKNLKLSTPEKIIKRTENKKSTLQKTQGSSIFNKKETLTSTLKAKASLGLSIKKLRSNINFSEKNPSTVYSIKSKIHEEEVKSVKSGNNTEEGNEVEKNDDTILNVPGPASVNSDEVLSRKTTKVLTKKSSIQITEVEEKKNSSQQDTEYNDFETASVKTTSSITFYSLVILNNKEKKFLSKIKPQNLQSKNVLSKNYMTSYVTSQNWIKENRIKLRPPKKQRVVHFVWKDFRNTKAQMLADAENFNEEIIKNFNDKLRYDKLLKHTLELGTSNYIMNKYAEITPEIISNFINETTNNNNNNINNRKRKIVRKNAIVKGGKSTNDVKGLSMFEKIIRKRNNILYYQKAIFQDYTSQYDLDWKKRLLEYKRNQSMFSMLDESFDQAYDDIMETYSDEGKVKVKKRKKRANLNLLKKIEFYKLSSRHKFKELTENVYLKYTKGRVDLTLNSILKELFMMPNSERNSEKYQDLVFQLLAHCISTLEEELFLQFFMTYRDVIDINLADGQGNTLLILSCKANATHIITFLLNNGADTDRKNIYGNTAIHYSVSYKYFHQVDLLRQFKAREDLVNNNGQMPWECLNHGCEEI